MVHLEIIITLHVSNVIILTVLDPVVAPKFGGCRNYATLENGLTLDNDQFHNLFVSIFLPKPQTFNFWLDNDTLKHFLVIEYSRPSL